MPAIANRTSTRIINTNVIAGHHIAARLDDQNARMHISADYIAFHLIGNTITIGADSIECRATEGAIAADTDAVERVGDRDGSHCIQADVIPCNDIRIGIVLFDKDTVAIDLSRNNISFAGVEAVIAAIRANSIETSLGVDHDRRTELARMPIGNAGISDGIDSHIIASDDIELGSNSSQVNASPLVPGDEVSFSEIADSIAVGSDSVICCTNRNAGRKRVHAGVAKRCVAGQVDAQEIANDRYIRCGA